MIEFGITARIGRTSASVFSVLADFDTTWPLGEGTRGSGQDGRRRRGRQARRNHGRGGIGRGAITE
jgi:hypothetical protein